MSVSLQQMKQETRCNVFVLYILLAFKSRIIVVHWMLNRTYGPANKTSQRKTFFKFKLLFLSLLSAPKCLLMFDVVCKTGCREEVGGGWGVQKVSSSDIQLEFTVTQCSVCWEIIWHFVFGTYKGWGRMEEKKGREGGVKGKSNREWRQREDSINSASPSPSCHRLSAYTYE